MFFQTCQAQSAYRPAFYGVFHRLFAKNPVFYAVFSESENTHEPVDESARVKFL
jgi:hypothetical protein